MSLETAVDAYLQPFVETGNFSGAILLARQGETLLARGYGMANYELEAPNTPSTRFHIASVSKPFTALAVLLLVERGALRLGDFLATYVPTVPGADRVTIDHLLTHTSGIPDINGSPFYEDLTRLPQTPDSLAGRLCAWLQESEMSAAPASYRYSNSNYLLLALILELVSGRTYGDVLASELFEPLGMHDTLHDGRSERLIPNRAAGYIPEGRDGVANAPFLDWSSKTGNGSLVSTVEDLARFHAGLVQERLLAHLQLRDRVRSGSGNRYGWFARTSATGPSLAANGRSPGFTASMEAVERDEGLIVVVSNSYATVSQAPIARGLLALLHGQEPDVSLRMDVLRPYPAAAGLVGRYLAGPDFYQPSQPIEILDNRDHLVMRWVSGLKSPLLPIGPGEYRDRLYWLRVRFECDNAGSARALYLDDGATVHRAVTILDTHPST
jgi:CubicO group peptidase (beta-lactamase class C family)